MAEKRIEPRVYLNIRMGFNILPAINQPFVIDILKSFDFSGEGRSLQEKAISLIPYLTPFLSWERGKTRVLFCLNPDKENKSILKSISCHFPDSETLFVNILKSDNRYFTSGYSLKSGKKHKLTSGKALSYYTEMIGDQISFNIEDSLKTGLESSLSDLIKNNDIKKLIKFLFNLSIADGLRDDLNEFLESSIKMGLPLDVICNVYSKNFKNNLSQLSFDTKEIKPFQLERTPYCLLDPHDEAFISRLIIERELGSSVTLRRKPSL